MGFVKKGASAFGKLFIVIALAGAFTVGAVGVIYMSLQGQEMKVPEIVGKDLVESEKELASLGLRIKKRADRYSTEKPNTILEQLPKAGDTVKTGQMILVVTSKTNPEGEEAPTTLKKNTNEQDDTEKIEELISDKPKKSNKSNTNTVKKKETTRDVISNNSNSNDNSASGNSSNANKSNSNSGTNKNTSNSNKSNSNAAKPNTNKTPASGGDVRPRRTPQP